MTLQWLAGIAAAYWISPQTWTGTTSQTHLHVWAALFLGGAISSLPIVLALTQPGSTAGIVFRRLDAADERRRAGWKA